MFKAIASWWNVLMGKLGLAAGAYEAANPEAVYESAINERIARHQELKKAVGGIVFLRNKTSTELEAKEKELGEVNQQIPVAVQANEDEVALVLLERKTTLEGAIAGLKAELQKISAQAEESKKSLISFQGEIEKLRRERDEMLAKKATAEARIKIQESLDGLSTDADIRALDNVRENIGKLQAQADVGAEIQGGGLDAKLARVREQAGNLAARAQLDELKRQMAAQSAASVSAGGGEPPKTI
jgi:phage shock protein A